MLEVPHLTILLGELFKCLELSQHCIIIVKFLKLRIYDHDRNAMVIVKHDFPTGTINIRDLKSRTQVRPLLFFKVLSAMMVLLNFVFSPLLFVFSTINKIIRNCKSLSFKNPSGLTVHLNRNKFSKECYFILMFLYFQYLL